MLNKNLWGRNYPLILNCFVLLITVLLIISVGTNNNEIITHLQEEDLSAATYSTSFLRGDVDINQFWHTYQTTTSKLSTINRSASISSIYHNSDLIINNLVVERSTTHIFYVSQNLWNTLTENATTELVLVNRPEDLNHMGQYNITIPIENKTILLDYNKVEHYSLFPEILSAVGTSDSTGISLSGYEVVGIIMPITNGDPDLPKLRNDDGGSHWKFKSEIYLVDRIIEDAKTTGSITDHIIQLTNQVDTVMVSYNTSTTFYSELYEVIERGEKNLYLQLQTDVTWLIPAIISFGIFYLYFIKIRLVQIEDKFKLLHTRGFSVKQLKANMIIHFVLVPLFVFITTTSILILTNILLRIQVRVLASLLVPWFLLQSLSTTFLILYKVRTFQNDKYNQSKLKPLFNFKWYWIFAILSLYTLIRSIISYYSFQTTFWYNTKNISDLPKYVLPLGWFAIFFILLLVTLLLEILIQRLSNNTRSSISKQYLERNKSLIIVILIIVILSMGYIAAGSLRIETLNDRNQDSVKSSDFYVSFNTYSSQSTVNFKHPKVMNVEGLTSYLTVYDQTVRLSGHDFELTLSLYLYNQTLYDDYECRRCIKNDTLFGDSIWVNDRLDSFLFSDTDADSVSITHLKSYSIRTNLSSAKQIPSTKFARLVNIPTIIEALDEKYLMVASVESFSRLGFEVVNYNPPDLMVNFDKAETLTEETVRNRLSKQLDFNGYDISIKKTGKPNYFTYEDPSPQRYVLIFGNLFSMVFATLLFAKLSIIDDSAINEFRRISQRYGKTKLVYDHFQMLIVIFAALVSIGFVDSVIFGIFVMGGDNLELINNTIRFPDSFTLKSVLKVLIAGSGGLFIIYSIACYLGYSRIEAM